ncbi:MAG: hypothetical protein H6827_06890 [Planctomycetes bacterium]|nr:hypothetical protein [Planctomycetota bacterium]HPF12885.1 hypothetical protein [Planctomycetota bacterium]
MGYTAPVLAFIANLDLSEIALIVVGAIIVFGKDLPKVVMRGMQQFVKIRRAATQMWRDAGLEQELQQVRKELDATGLPSPRQLLSDSRAAVEAPVQTWRKSLEKELTDVVPVEKPTLKRPEPVEAPTETLAAASPEAPASGAPEPKPEKPPEAEEPA